jgi:hypothetical protein
VKFKLDENLSPSLATPFTEPVEGTLWIVKERRIRIRT